MFRLMGCILCAIALFMNVPVYAGAPVIIPYDLWAAAPAKPAPGKPTKLDTPTNVTCSRSGDTLTVQWDVVSGAAFYRVMLEADEEQGLVENTPAPPYTQTLSEITDDPTAPATVKVRAMQTKQGKGASKPSEAVTCLMATQLPAR
jgi:hypothetical protein